MWVKICGLTRQEDVDFAIECGADALGFVQEPTSPRCVEGREFKVPHTVDSVAVFGELTKQQVPWATAIQFVKGTPTPEMAMQKKLRVHRFGDSNNNPELASTDFAIVLDAYHPAQYGGTGTLLDWEQAANFVNATKHRVILAGGLTPENVAEAIRVVRPWGVDVSSGVESAARLKDPAKVRAFIEASKST